MGKVGGCAGPLVCALSMVVLMVLGSFERASAAPKVSTKTIYFTVRGSTPSQVLQSILSRGPGLTRGGKAMATTQAKISQTLKPKGKNGCRYSSRAVITLRLPRIAKSSLKSRSVRRVWSNFDRYIRAHENRHKSIFLSCARRIDKKARAYIRRNGCKNAKLKITQIMVDERLRCNRLNQAYDRRERSRIRALPLIRQARAGTRATVASAKKRKKRVRRAKRKRN
ncbi:MAG: DUF922 domain-containing protein [Pseudomonadota bacterium]